MVKKLIFVFFSILVSLFLVEIILQRLPHSTLKFYDNNIFGSALIPNQKEVFVSETSEYKNLVQVNSHGWPDIEHSYDKPDGIYRILILGDSFVENFQVPLEARFYRQLQNKLGSKYEIIAMARGNTGTAPQYLMLKNYGLKYKPDLVIHMFFEANDIKNNSPKMQNDPFLPYFTIDSGGGLVEIPRSNRIQKKLASIKEFLTNFRLIALLFSARRSIIEQNQSSRFGYPIDYHVYDKSYNEEYTKTWEATKKLILETKKMVENAGGKYVFVASPGNEQIQKDVQGKITQTYPKFSLSEIDFNKPGKILKEFCNQEAVDCYFMYPFFQEYLSLNPKARLYYFYDGHWNQTGTDVAAEFLYQNLKDYFKT